MISTKCDKRKNKAWCWSCDECQSKPFQCFVYNKIITYRDRHKDLQVHFKNPNQYLVCRRCRVNKHISQYRFKHFIVGYAHNFIDMGFIIQKKDSWNMQRNILLK